MMSTQNKTVTGARNAVRGLASPAATGSKYITGRNNGIETEESVRNALNAVNAREYKAQRDELLAALKASALELAMRGAFHTESGLPTPLQRDIEAAIARAEGRAE